MIASSRQRFVARLLQLLADESALSVTGEPVAESRTLLTELTRRRPAVLLLDKPLLDALDTRSAATIYGRGPALGVLLLCDRASGELVDEVVGHRFSGFVVADNPEVCIRALRTVAAGELWLPRAMIARAVYGRTFAARGRRAATTKTLASPVIAAHLTRREKQVIDLLNRGRTNKQIAHVLEIGEDTVKKHLWHAFKKLGVHRRAEVMLSHLHDGGR